MLAETPQPSGGAIFVILLILLAVLAAHVVVVILGCAWAWRAGRGSQAALAGLAIVGAVEALYLLSALPTVMRGEPNLYLGWAAVPAVAQVGLYVGGRRSRAPDR